MKRRSFIKTCISFVAGCYLAVGIEPKKELVEKELYTTHNMTFSMEDVENIMNRFTWDATTGTLYFRNDETPNT